MVMGYYPFFNPYSWGASIQFSLNLNSLPQNLLNVTPDAQCIQVFLLLSLNSTLSSGCKCSSGATTMLEY